jgi:hypothetical protein
MRGNEMRQKGEEGARGDDAHDQTARTPGTLIYTATTSAMTTYKQQPEKKSINNGYAE